MAKARTNACFQCHKVFVIAKDYDWYCSPKCFKLYWKAYKTPPRAARKKELRPVKKGTK